jgi:hypothetical protein
MYIELGFSNATSVTQKMGCVLNLKWGALSVRGGVRCVNVYVNVNELRLGFSNTTRNPEGILSHNNRKS